MADLQKIVDDLSSLTVLEAAELAKLLEEKWGVSAAAAVAVAGPAGGGENDGELGLFLSRCRGSAATRRTRNCYRSRRGDAPLLFEELGEFSRFEHGEAREVVDDFL